MTAKARPIRRDNVYHVQGERLPSVTTVTGMTPKPMLVRWAAKIAAAAALDDPDKYNTADLAADAADKVKTDAAERGRGVHTLIEVWAGTGAAPEEKDVSPELAGYARAFRTFLRAWNPVPLFTECVVINTTYGYAGRLDLIARLGEEIWIVDFKTAKAVWPEYRLQLTAYRNAEQLMADPQNPTALQPMPPVDHTGVVLLRENGTFDFVTAENDFDVFLALKKVYEWSRKRQGD
jgi:hypothetical protein